MPYVTVKMLEGRTEEQKKALAESNSSSKRNNWCS